jgi:hypothetical protein
MERNLTLTILCLLQLPWLGVSSISAQPVKVEIIENDTGYELLRGGEPYYIKGAGAKEHFALLEESGANSIRLWSTSKAALLDSAVEHGMTVCLGLNIRPERTGMDYNDEYAVRGQIEQLKQEVLKFKDHPAILFWGIGNEVDLKYANFKVWETVEELARFIKEVDPNHPTMTVIAGLNASKAFLINKHCPSVDVLGVNAYGSIERTPINIRKYNWDKPYVVTEWGVNGPFEAKTTSWKAKLEPPNGVKAAQRFRRYKELIEDDEERCLGSYCFLWGQKQESTATWHGMFIGDGCPTDAVDVMHHCWTGDWPENRAASVMSMELNDVKWNLDHVISGGSSADLSVEYQSYNNKEVAIELKLYPESQTKKMGGDQQKSLEEIPLEIVSQELNQFTFIAPKETGAYRVFAYTQTEHGRCSVANIPFLVE